MAIRGNLKLYLTLFLFSNTLYPHENISSDTENHDLKKKQNSKNSKDFKQEQILVDSF